MVKNQLDFYTAIITYPSDYDGLLSIGLIVDKFQSITRETTKVVIAREDPDEEIQRSHFHCYWDDEKTRKHVSTKYFDIKLPEPVVVFVHNDSTRTYKLLTQCASELGWDTHEEMVAQLEEYTKENNYKSYDILSVAHPNIQLKKEYGDKYFMLRYVVKQKLICRSNFDIDEELKYLQDKCEELCNKANELIEQDLLKQLNIKTIDELIHLLKMYKLKQLKKQNRKAGLKLKKRGRRSNSDLDNTAIEFREWLRPLVISSRLTKKEVIKEITKNHDWWQIFSSNYINYNKLINDMFRGKPPTKPKRNYQFKFWLPRKLYNYVIWLDDWVRRWNTGEKLEHRPKGLVLIGPSRTGKTSLMSLFGEFSYIKNVWNLDCWEGKTAYTIMDDMDAGDEGKGLSFCWYKPFFGAQDAITVTDKFKPKEDIYNGKPLIWINNYDYTETFQSKTAQEYIRKNMEIVYINESLFEPKDEWIENHTDYIEFDPTQTWFYQNIINQKIKCLNCGNYDFMDYDTNQPLAEFSNNANKLNYTNWNCDLCNSKQWIFVDETLNTIKKCKEQEDDLECLSNRKKRILEEKEDGRHNKRIRTEDTSESNDSQ
jgi:hypothetical protein